MPKTILNRYKGPVFIADRDWEVVKRIITEKLGVINEQDINNIMQDFKSKSGIFDAESFIIYLENLSAERFSKILTTDDYIEIIKKRTWVESKEEAFDIFLKAKDLALNNQGSSIHELYQRKEKIWQIQ